MNWKGIAFLGVYLCAALVAIMGVFTFGPVIETRLWPAYGKFRLVFLEPLPDAQSRAIFEFEKRRECSPAGFAWFNGEIGNSYQHVEHRVETVAGDGLIRPTGWHLSNPYILNATVDQVRTRLIGEIYSRCHPFWITRSEVYP